MLLSYLLLYRFGLFMLDCYLESEPKWNIFKINLFSWQSHKKSNSDHQKNAEYPNYLGYIFEFHFRE